MRKIDKEFEEIVSAIIAEPSDDFGVLLNVGGIDPREDLQGADMSDIDFGKVDINEWDLTDTRLDRADLSRVKNIDKARFAGDVTMEDTLLPEGVSVNDLIS